MRDNLRRIVGKTYTFSDGKTSSIPGMVLEAEGILKINYFFIPYDTKIAPFRINSGPEDRVRVSRKTARIYGRPEDLNKQANGKELEQLAFMEGILRSADPKAEIEGREIPLLIKVPVRSASKYHKTRTPEWIHSFGL